MSKETEKVLQEILAKLHTIPSTFESDEKVLDDFCLEGRITEQHAKEILERIGIYRAEILKEVEHIIKDYLYEDKF